MSSTLSITVLVALGVAATSVACGSTGGSPDANAGAGPMAGATAVSGGAPGSAAGSASNAGSPASAGDDSGAASGAGGTAPVITCDTPGQAEPDPVALTFSASDEDFLNPERGFHEDIPLPADAIGDVRGGGFSLMRSYIILSDFRNSAISSDFLAQLKTSFDLARSAGIKLVPRFAYNQDGTEDAPYASVMQHIAQLKPLLQESADVIAVVQAGFIGQWGEWHDSVHGLNTPTNRQQILQAVLDALPSSRMVQMRYPWQRKQIFPTALTDLTAFTEMGAARVGHHNDCFVTSDDDYGTYGNFTNDPSGNPSSSEIATWKAYTAAESRYVAVGGETCANLARSACTTATAELAQFHYSYLNARYDPDVNDRWVSEGCMPEIRKRLGYRFALQSGSISQRVAPGGLLQLSFSVQNQGYAAPYNARTAYVVLDGPTRISAALNTDVRHWSPEAGTIQVSATLRVPATLAPGSYRVALALPDTAPAFATRPEYSMRLANGDVWNDTAGDNTLYAALQVDASAGGCVDSSAASFVQVGP